MCRSFAAATLTQTRVPLHFIGGVLGRTVRERLRKCCKRRACAVKMCATCCARVYRLFRVTFVLTSLVTSVLSRAPVPYARFVTTLLCGAQDRDHATHHTDRHPRRVDHRQLSDSQSKRPWPASVVSSCPDPELLLAACCQQVRAESRNAMDG